MSKSAWCDSNTIRDVLKLHDFCPNAKCKTPKQTTFIPNHFQLEAAVFKKIIKTT